MKTTITILITVVLFSFHVNAGTTPFKRNATRNAKHERRVDNRRAEREFRRIERQAEKSARRAKHFQKKKTWIRIDKKTNTIIPHGKKKKFLNFRI
jgi:hypothetical protein